MRTEKTMAAIAALRGVSKPGLINFAFEFIK